MLIITNTILILNLSVQLCVLSVKYILYHKMFQLCGSSHLVTSFLLQLASVEKLWQEGLCASLYKGSWISKSWDPRPYSLSVIEFSLSLSLCGDIESPALVYDVKVH